MIEKVQWTTSVCLTKTQLNEHPRVVHSAKPGVVFEILLRSSENASNINEILISRNRLLKALAGTTWIQRHIKLLIVLSSVMLSILNYVPETYTV